MAKSNYYEIFLQECINLAATLIIKSESTASLMNDYINLQVTNANQIVSDYYDASDKTTWKYYLNLSGQYLKPFDQVIYVKSLDTLQDIEFTPENLQNNPLTFQAYQFGSSYYNKLIAEYPNQIPLINSILYPVDIETAINAPDGQILAYETSLVESNEYHLISDIQNFINVFKQRWNNTGFEITDSLYIVANLGIMYLNIVPLILNSRLKYAKTPEAHSFHVTQYLRSHNNLNTYTDQFSLSEKLYLYRNINYIQRNIGQQQTFQSLIDELITPNKIDLVTYKLVESGFDSAGNTKIRLKQKSLTNTVNNGDIYYHISDILTYEESLYSNANFINNYSTEISNQLTNTRYNNLPTKIIKTNTQANIPLVEHTKEDTVLNAWGWLADQGYYTANINFVNPVDQNEYTLSAIDAFLYMVYIEASALNISLEYVPPYYLSRVPVTYYLSLTNLTNMLSLDNIPDNSPNVLNDFISDQITLDTMTTVEDFVTYTDKLYNIIEAQDIYINSIGEADRRAQYKIMIDQFYADEIIDFPSTYGLISDWLLKNKLPIYSYTINEASELISNIILAATGRNYNINKGINFNRNLVELLSVLSSYNVQYLITENKTEVYIIENGIGLNSESITASYADSEGNVYSNPTYNAGYSSYSAYGYIGEPLYNSLSEADKQSLKDIYNL